MLQNHKFGSQKIFPLLPQPGGTRDLCDMRWEVSAGDGLLIPSLLFICPLFLLERWEFIGYHWARKMMDKFTENNKQET